MARTNCVVWACLLWWRRHRLGREGYVLMRRSRLAKNSLHALYAERRRDGTLRVVSYVPVDPVRRWFPPLRFTGRVEWGDEHQEDRQ